MESSDVSRTYKDGVLSITAISPVNIALIKYWGKVEEKYIIPLNNSLSITLSTDDLCSTTCVSMSKAFKENSLVLNGEDSKFTDRIKNMLDTIQAYIPQEGITVKDEDGVQHVIDKSDLVAMKLRIVSDNNFPTASGVASSSSGLSCLALCLAKIYGLDFDFSEISRLARLGSGSASRSLFGGFVEWERGFKDFKELDEDIKTVDKGSKAIQVCTQSHWPDICCFIMVADSEKKKVSSTKGMKDSVDTSEFLKHRENVIVPRQLERIKKALNEKDWPLLAEVTMQESNNLHAVCLDTYPPIFYMNSTTKSLISMIHDLNSTHSEPVAAYTVDAGANCFVVTKREYAKFILNTVVEASGIKSEDLNESAHNHLNDASVKEFTPDKKVASIIDEYKGKINLNRIIATKVGEGVKFIKNESKLMAKL